MNAGCPTASRDQRLRVLVIGAAGMLGRKLGERLVSDGALGSSPIRELLLADVVPPEPIATQEFAVQTAVIDLACPGAAHDLLDGRPNVIFDLAAVVSGEAEADFDKGYRVNLDASRLLFEAIRAAGDRYRPRVVFSSSI